MPEPFTLIYIASYVISGIIGSKSNQYFDLAVKSVSNRLLGNWKSSENYDVLKAVRKSCLRASLDICNHMEKRYKSDRKRSSKKIENLNHLRRYLDRQIAEADKLNFDLSNYEEVAQKTEILLTHSKKNTLVEIGQKQKDLMLQELNYLQCAETLQFKYYI